ncbi:MAG: thioredoxin domain-containing protein [Sphingomonas aquatilis]|uniref:thioredoxin domain-containing protein n=1 Tax=Sphingomonas aquatilis TaxID=93063 RepID=UPI002F31CD76
MSQKLIIILRAWQGGIMKATCFVAAAILLAGLTACADPGERLSQYYIKHPEALQEALNRLAQYQEQEDTKAVMAAISASSSWLYSDEYGNRLGSVNAPIKVAMFTDYNCAVCKKAIKSLINDPKFKNGEVSIFIHDLPILGEDSAYFARIGMMAQSNEKFAEYFEGLMAIDRPSRAYAEKLAMNVGIDPKAAITEPALSKSDVIIRRNRDFFRRVGASGTPVFITRGELFKGWNPLKKPF